MISYDAGAASYDQLSGRWSQLYIPTLLAQAGVAVGHRVLDVATGTGEAAILAVSHVGAGGKVVGIDVSRPMLGVAAAKVGQRPIAFLQMDAQALAFKDESFDAVVCQLGLMFLPDAVRAPREWRSGVAQTQTARCPRERRTRAIAATAPAAGAPNFTFERTAGSPSLAAAAGVRQNGRHPGVARCNHGAWRAQDGVASTPSFAGTH